MDQNQKTDTIKILEENVKYANFKAEQMVFGKTDKKTIQVEGKPDVTYHTIPIFYQFSDGTRSLSIEGPEISSSQGIQETEFKKKEGGEGNNQQQTMNIIMAMLKQQGKELPVIAPKTEEKARKSSFTTSSLGEEHKQYKAVLHAIWKRCSEEIAKRATTDLPNSYSTYKAEDKGLFTYILYDSGVQGSNPVLNQNIKYDTLFVFPKLKSEVVSKSRKDYVVVERDILKKANMKYIPLTRITGIYIGQKAKVQLYLAGGILKQVRDGSTVTKQTETLAELSKDEKYVEEINKEYEELLITRREQKEQPKLVEEKQNGTEVPPKKEIESATKPSQEPNNSSGSNQDLVNLLAQFK